MRSPSNYRLYTQKDGFSHAPAAKRQLMQQGIPYITLEGTLGGGALAATALNTLVESLIDKPNCHCYLK